MPSPNRERFVQEYIIDLNATQAAIRAGYSKNGASVQGARLLANASIRQKIALAQAERAKKSQVNAAWVLERLIKNHDRAAQAEPVIDAKGKETGEYVYQGPVVNKSLELIGKHLGMFIDRVETLERVKLEIVEEIVERHAHNQKDDGTPQGPARLPSQ